MREKHLFMVSYNLDGVVGSTLVEAIDRADAASQVTGFKISVKAAA